jgi:CubicO group peptidase (beta-lactamase class C family)
MKTSSFSLSVLGFCLLTLPTAVADPIAERMRKLVNDGVISGAVTLVATKDSVKHLAVVGKSDLASGRAMKTDDLFWIASMTKPMTAVCVAMLADEGKLALDDPVEKFLPEFRNQWLISEGDKERRVLIRPARVITLRDLLTHTSGIGEVSAPRPDSSLAELCMAYAREPLTMPPGSKWQYSNPGINTLGRVVEVVSKMPFAEFIQRRLFDPLGMKDTTFWPTPAQAGRVAKSYKANDAGKLEETEVFFHAGAPLTDRTRTPFPAGGLYSMAEDCAKFYQMMLNGGKAGGQTILKPETVSEMTRTQTDDIKTGFVDGMSWGLGFQVVKTPQGVTAPLAAGTFGHGGAYATQSWADPQRGFIYILMVQRAGLPNGDASDIRRVFQETAVATVR